MWNYSFVFTRFFRRCELDNTNTGNLLEKEGRFLWKYWFMADEYTGNASGKYMRTRRCPGTNKRCGYEMLQKSRVKSRKIWNIVSLILSIIYEVSPHTIVTEIQWLSITSTYWGLTLMMIWMGKYGFFWSWDIMTKSGW